MTLRRSFGAFKSSPPLLRGLSQLEDHRKTSQAPYNPKRTMEIRKNEFQIGTETLAELDRDYTRILSQDLRYRTYRNPRTGNVEGIQITDVRPGSLPAQHGVSKGEVLISINGHPVKGVNDAVAYVKAHADTTDTWEAVFLKQGREITRTYRSPRN